MSDLDGKKKKIEFGIYTLGDLARDPFAGSMISPQKRIQEVIESAKLAEDAGLDLFGVGEHHRLDYAVSSPAIVLAAIARETKRIKLTSAATVLSTADPVRIFEDFSTLDLLSGGRAEIMTGRGAFTEPFSLFGYALEDNQALFTEKLELLQKLIDEEVVTWHGRFRTDLQEAEIAPRPLQQKLPIWIGVGGSVESAEFAGRHGTHMAIAILKGDAARFQPLADAYWQAAKAAGHDLDKLKLGITGHAFIAETPKMAKEDFYPYYANYRQTVNRQRGKSFTLSRTEFEQLAAPDTSLFVGSPEQIAEKIVTQHQMFGHRRFIAQVDIGGVPFAKAAKSIELLAGQVKPLVEKALQ